MRLVWSRRGASRFRTSFHGLARKAATIKKHLVAAACHPDGSDL